MIAVLLCEDSGLAQGIFVFCKLLFIEWMEIYKKCRALARHVLYLVSMDSTFMTSRW